MDKNEKQIREEAETIVDALVYLMMGNEPRLLSGKTFRHLPKHKNYLKILQLFKEFVIAFDGKIDTLNEHTLLTTFRYKIVELFEDK